MMFYRKRIEQLEADVKSLEARLRAYEEYEKAVEKLLEVVKGGLADLTGIVRDLKTVSASTTRKEPPPTMAEVVRQWIGGEEVNDG